MINYWWVTRPKRKLNSIPEVLGAFSNVAILAAHQWKGQRAVHLLFEEELEHSGLKRIGARRDQSGSGGRTYQAWLFSLGLIFYEETTGVPYLTLAGEAIMRGQSPVEVLTAQVLKYQFPSSFGIKTRVSDRFRIRPFYFILNLLRDSRIGFYLTQEELAKVVITDADSETNSCYERVINRIIDFREHGDSSLVEDFFERYAPTTGRVNPDHPFSHLEDTANTILNWLEYTQLVRREEGKVFIAPDKYGEVSSIVEHRPAFITRPDDQEFYQRKYGLDPGHQKDTRNLLSTRAISSRDIEIQRIRQAFIAHSIHNPVSKVSSSLVSQIASVTGTDPALVETVLFREYPHGAIGGFLAGYYEMAFKGRDEAIDFEVATTNLFKDVFGYNATHLGQTGSISAPDVLLLSDNEGYQAIIDNKAYSEYSITGDHRNRMVHNYIENIANYSSSALPLAFFTYIAGGFASNIDSQVLSIARESHVRGSCVTVGNVIKLIERNQLSAYSHADLRSLFTLNRQISIMDIANG